MNLYEAIRNRRSVRTYRKVRVSADLLCTLKTYADKVMPLDERIKTEFVFLGPDDKGVKVRGMFQAHAPYCLAVYSEERPGWGINAGYMMEQMALYMVTKGLGSCYLGAVKAVGLEREGMRQVMLLAFGYPKRELCREQEQARRLDLKELCVYPEGTGISPDIAAILQAARLAPSSFNSQPWRFVVRHDRIHVFICHNKMVFSDLGRLQEFNIGIVLSHIVLAAEEQWVTAEIVREEQLTEREYKNGKYICTVRLH